MLNTYVTDVHGRPEERIPRIQLMEGEGVVQDLEMLIQCRTAGSNGLWTTDGDAARAFPAVAEELTGSSCGFVGKVKRGVRFDTPALSDPGWEACRMSESKALRLLKDMEIRGSWGKVIEEEEYRIVDDPGSGPDQLGLPEGRPPIIRFIGVPLKQAGRTVSMIALANKEPDFDQKTSNPWRPSLWPLWRP